MSGLASDQDLVGGGELGHYRIVEKIGAGGMGDVYRAHDHHLDRDVAIKVLPAGMLADESARKRFHKEALALSRLNHPNIATIYDFDTEQGVDFLVMELIPGITLSHKLALGPQPEKETLRLGIQLADGLADAHKHGVVHCDLKPGNLRLTTDGWLKILDFGLAKFRQQAADPAETQSTLQSGPISGTLPYMAPEQLLGEPIDARTDIHAAGLVLYEMATGKRAFADVPTSQLIGAILHHDPPAPRQLNASLSSELEWIVRKCLERNPEDRYQSARDLAAELRRIERQPHAQYPPETAPTEPMFSFRSSPRDSFVLTPCDCDGDGIGAPDAHPDALPTRGRRPAISGDRRSPAGQSLGGSGTGVLRRRHDRRADHPTGEGGPVPGHLAPVRHAIQRHQASAR